ncbi:MAG: 1,2-dihydroxy-3-keto-5-methylthiopentene dioxygenase [Tremellales sp. Tagirdzhanova-0007]|nr:MAG: 1,2-dihydroxy-3-keto-5-methylthiopentene dioxygenase [Tremellales sp. Tagirdzhanova-0007]
MKAYTYDNLPGDQREPHEGDAVSLITLAELGVIYKEIPVDDGGKWEKTLDEFAKEKGYKNRDLITVTKAGLGDSYEEKIKMFFEEHLHEDEEIRYVKAGSGFFDVRGFGEDYHDQWIRLALVPGDLLVLPAGIYHRFTVDTANTITGVRLFQDEPKWTPLPRAQAETERVPARQTYVEHIKHGDMSMGMTA